MNGEYKDFITDNLGAYLNYDMVIGWRGANIADNRIINPTTAPANLIIDNVITGCEMNADNASASYKYSCQKTLYRIAKQGRCVGVVLGVNDDDSLQVALLGDFTIRLSAGKSLERVSTINAQCLVLQDDKMSFTNLVTWTTAHNSSGQPPRSAVAFSNTINSGFVTLDDAFDSEIIWNDVNGSDVMPTFFQKMCKLNGSDLPLSKGANLQLTRNISTTLTLCAGVDRGFPYSSDVIAKQGHVYENLQGNLYDYMTNFLSYFNTFANGMKPPLNMAVTPVFIPYVGTYAMQGIIYNVPLTYDYNSAIHYLNTGTLPSDAFLYPFNPDDIPTSKPINPDDEDAPDEEDNPGVDGVPTVDGDPAITPTQLSNNNLYWLQAGELQQFISWFWNNAGEIIEADDLWDRIKGLYNDLASAVINIRYFPVNPYYIGGVSDTNNIIISSIQMPIQNIKKINKGKLVKRTLGEYSINEQFKAFTDYSPYTQLMLYLPFHGWIELDVDVFMTNKIRVKCVYDYISGTIQYGVYCVSNNKEFIINTVISKMAVDIPITLQSKNDRDSAIFNNVTNAFGNLLGAGASAVTGSPIGLVMSTAGVASSGTQSAPLKVNGTMGESGAFFMPNKCAVYIKRPSYNRPNLYKSRVAYPCNKGGELSNFKGLTLVYDPQISFSGNKNADNITIKPLQSEIDEIYTALEKGVIL